MKKISLFTVFIFSISDILLFRSAFAELKLDFSSTAKNINVRILGPGDSGSGVIVKKDDDEYIVLTAGHVLKDITKTDEIYIQTNDKNSHPYVEGSIQKIKNIDIALIKFKSSNTYEVAVIGDIENSRIGDSIFVYGYPLENSSISISSPRLQPGKITAISSKFNKDGYQVLYTNRTFPGMSGGSILNEKGELIGIHGRSEIDEIYKDENKLISTGTNLGIPISYFKNFILENLPVSNNQTNKNDDFLINALFNLRKYEKKPLEMFFLAKKSVEQNPTSLGFTLLGRAQILLDDKELALQNYKKAIDLNPRNEYALNYLAPHLNNKEAIKAYSTLIEIKPKNNEYFYQRAIKKHFSGDIKGSLRDLQSGIKIYSSLKGEFCNKFFSDFLDFQERYNIQRSYINVEDIDSRERIKKEDYDNKYDEYYKRKNICKSLRDTHVDLLKKISISHYVFNNTKQSCFYWKELYDNYSVKSISDSYGYYWSKAYITLGPNLEGQPNHVRSFNEDRNYNIDRAREMSDVWEVDLAKYMYKYCL